MSEKVISIRIAIDIPVDAAEETLVKIQSLVSQLAGQATEGNQAQKAIDLEVEELKEAGRLERERYLKEFEKKSVQAYRMYRRSKDEFSKTSQLHSFIAQHMQWPTSVVPSVVSGRRRKVKAYLDARRRKTAWELARKGLTNKSIGERLKVNTRTVARLLKEVREQKKGGQNA